MNYSVLNVPEVESDIRKAFSYYSGINSTLPLQFLDCLQEALQILSNSPFFELKYKNVRTLKLKQFPYLTHFIIDEERKNVIILAIAIAKENPVNYAKRIND